ncbi:phytochelatin synthase family protein [Leptolyngbya sp. FACHB-671]|nr:phytochelatin synthase family protein [Leptolyngbya sp. FACHB-671]
MMAMKKQLFSFSRMIAMPALAFLVGISLVSGRFISKALPVSSNLIPLNSTEGEQLLLTSTAQQDYLPLSTYFVTQKNVAYCGIASMVMVLNALSIPAPAAPELGNTHTFTQDNVFNDQMRQIRSPLELSFRGMTLDHLRQFLVSYSVKADVHYGSDITLDEFRNLVSKNLQEPNNFVVVNYLRQAINQKQAGHISPVAAYHQLSDRFLILDVSRYKYPPVWVRAEELWKAIATPDSESNKTRGFILVSAK